MAKAKEFNISSNAVTVLTDTEEAAKNAKQELKELQKQMLSMDVSSEEFQKAAARAGELKDTINDTADAIRTAGGPALESINNTLGIMAGQITNLDFGGLGQSLTSLGGAVNKISFKTLKDELGSLIKGFGNLAFSILSNPFLLIGASVAALGYTFRKELLSPITNIISANDKLRESIKFTSEEITAAAGDEVKQIAKLEELKIVLNDTTTSTKNRKEAVKELKKINPTYFKDLDDEKIKYTDLNTQIDTYIKGLVAQSLAKAASSRIEQESAKYLDDEIKRKQDLETVTAKLAIAQAELADKSKAVEESGKNIFGGKSYGAGYERAKTTAAATGYSIQQLELEKKALIDSEATSKSAYEQRVKDLTNFKKTQEEIAAGFGVTTPGAEDKDKKDLEKQLEANAIRAAKELKLEKELADAKLKVREDYIKANQSAQANELYELEKKKELELQTYEGDEEDKIYIIEKYRLLEIDINKKYDDLLLQQQIEANQKEKDERDKRNEANAIQAAKELDDLKKLEALKSETRLRQVGESFDALTALNDAFTKKGQQQSRKQFQIQKALNLASAVVDTYGGINRALNDKTMPSTTARIIQASIVGAMGLANVLKISKTEYGNASAPSGTNMSAGSVGGGTEAPSPANFAFLGNQPNQQQPPLQAYVVSGQVSSNLEAQQLIQNQSRLGG